MIGQAAKFTTGRKRKNAVNIGVCACYLAILEGYTVEGAFDYIETGEVSVFQNNTQKDVIDMIIMKEKKGFTYREIAEIYDTRNDTIYRKIERFVNKKRAKDMKSLKEKGFTHKEIGDLYDLSPQRIWQIINNNYGEDKIGYTKGKLIEQLKKFYSRNYRMPKSKEINECTYMACDPTFRNKFDGGLKEAKEIARRDINDKMG